MNFNCYLCSNRLFDNNKDTVSHLKKEHKIKQKIHQIKCTVRNSKCGKQFQTFAGLNQHVKTCLNNNSDSVENDSEHRSITCDNVQNSKHRRPSSLIFHTSAEINTANADENNNTFVCNNNDEFNVTTSVIENDSFVLNSSTQTSQAIVETPGEATTKFFAGLLQLNLNETTMDSIVELTEILLNKTHQFSNTSIQTQKENPLEMLDCSMNLVVNGLRRFNTSYKRKQFIKNHESYIQPQQVGIGTHFELQRDKETGILEQVHKQSTFSYVSPLEIIKKIFQKSHVREAYFNHQAKKHTCEPNVFRDFCCGSTFKGINLFKEYPNSLQLQLFIDGFEVCSPLKTKTTMHSQVAVYLSIRNMPEQFAHSMDNIHLVCLVNDIDLKKNETGYTNILEIIVRDIKVLESSGIDLDCDTNLKGKINEKKLLIKNDFNVLIKYFLFEFQVR